MTRETPIRFACGDEFLIGMVHGADAPAKTGVLIVVGGPQYRVGSHRQFLLLARELAAAGIPAMRFDCRGMGDSDGEFPGFENIDDDISAAIDAFVAGHPGLERIVLWGLCDAASASLFYAHKDPRIAGLVMLNPWVRTESGEARAQIKHYYSQRLFDPGLWRKIFRGEFDFAASLQSFKGILARASKAAPTAQNRADTADSLPDRMAAGLAAFAHPVMTIISGNDLTAREFEDAAGASPLWRRLLADDRVARRDLKSADHTFSRAEWRDQVANWTVAWVRGL